MTAPTPKPDEKPPRADSAYPVRSRWPLSACLAFVIFALALIRVLPAPHGRADYSDRGHARHDWPR